MRSEATSDNTLNAIIAFVIGAVIISFIYAIYDFNIKTIVTDKQQLGLYERAIDIGLDPTLVTCALELHPINKDICLVLSLSSSESDKNRVRSILNGDNQ